MNGQMDLFSLGFGEWISTKDRQPETDGVYLVVLKNERQKGQLPAEDWKRRRNVKDFGTWYYEITTRYCGHYFSDPTEVSWTGYSDEILFWMPLPDFPVMEDER